MYFNVSKVMNSIEYCRKFFLCICFMFSYLLMNFNRYLCRPMALFRIFLMMLFLDFTLCSLWVRGGYWPISWGLHINKLYCNSEVQLDKHIERELGDSHKCCWKLFNIKPAQIFAWHDIYAKYLMWLADGISHLKSLKYLIFS